MITYYYGSIFGTDAVGLVNPVNTVGTMGKGLAMQFKIRYPEMFLDYHDLCLRKELTTGQLHIYRIYNVAKPRIILNFPTKNHWRESTKIEYIMDGLDTFVTTYKNLTDLTSVAFPKLGCGLGGLRWEDMKPVMESFLSDLDIPVYIYM